MTKIDDLKQYLEGSMKLTIIEKDISALENVDDNIINKVNEVIGRVNNHEGRIEKVEEAVCELQRINLSPTITVRIIDVQYNEPIENLSGALIMLAREKRGES